jgi:DNA polymerase III subunit gamma/tau
LRMLAFEPALSGAAGGGPAPSARLAGQSGAAGGRRSGAPAVTAQQAAPHRAEAKEPAQQPVRTPQAGRAVASEARTNAATGAVDASGSVQTMRTHANQDHETHAEPASPVAGNTAAVGANANLREAAVQPDVSAADAEAASTPKPTVDASAPADRPANADEQNLTDSRVSEAEVADAADGARESAASPQAADETPRRAGGASAALDVLRNAGMKLSGGRSRPAPVAPAKAAAPDVPPKPAAPRVVVPTPDPARRAQQQPAAAARNAAARLGSSSSTVPPWEEIPPDAPGALDDYVPASADDAFFAPPDDGFAPVFDSGRDDVRMSPAAAPAPVVDLRSLPPAVALDALGFEGDWPALAVGLPLKGISYQLAFNSELIALDGKTLKLNVPVPQYADAAQVVKLKAALAERLAQPVEVVVEVGPARRTAAALDAAARAQRQQEAEREIGADPFVQSLIREFGASIVPGSIRPLMPAAPGSGAASAAH